MAQHYSLLHPDSEFDCAQLGDLRLNARVARVMLQLAASPDSSLPQTFQDPSQLEGIYRLLANTRATPEALLCAHKDKTVTRASFAKSVLVLHDSTSFKFGGSAKPGMGVVDPHPDTGFYAHFSLCVSADKGCPLGLGWIHAWYRSGQTHGKLSQNTSQYAPDRESLRWNDAVHNAGDDLRVGGVSQVVHVMDREADCLELLSDMCAHQHDFVVRAKADRRLESGRLATNNKLFSAIGCLESISVEYRHFSQYKTNTVLDFTSNPKTAKVSKSKDPTKQIKPRKKRLTWSEQRTAILEVRAGSVTVYGSNGCHAHIPAMGLKLNAVEVKESELLLDSDHKPISWMLLTTLPINTKEEIEAVIDIYKKRWIIEELNKAIKTGCAYEEHQFDHGDTYIKMLVLYTPIAIQMLQMRWLERYEPDTLAEEVLDENELDALYAHEAPRRKPLSATPTVQEVLKVIARLGGHLPQNGSPGWLVLSRGFEFLQKLTAGWCLAKSGVQRGRSL